MSINWTRMARVFLLTKGCGWARREERCVGDPEVVTGILYLLLFLLTLQMYLPNSQTAFSFLIKHFHWI